MDLATLTSKAAAAMAAGGFDKKVKFDFGSVGKLLLDGVAKTATNDDGAADATVSLDFEDFKKMLSGGLDPTMAFMTGKLKVAGDMSVAMKLQGLLKSFG